MTSTCNKCIQTGGGGVMIWGMFSQQTLSHLISNQTTAYLTIATDHFMATIFPSYNGFFQHDNVSMNCEFRVLH